jgi:selenocysteine-specific elongation factor
VHVVATAGHVDHGKSTLVRTLTGTDPDRWAEEKARGLTIDLGFAHATLPSGAEISFIDVPGHVRFLKNMLAGVGGVDACLFVVAATEGWKPQSEEHLRILQLLGIRNGIIALTKVGLVDDEWEELARLDVADHVAGTFLEGAPIVGVDAPTGRGVAELQAALDTLLLHTPTAIDRSRPRLWIDRVFAAKGAGTIVTGTLTGGSLKVDDHVDVLRTHSITSEVASVRVRGLQSHGVSVKQVGPGNRVAVNMSGLAHDEIARGDAVVHHERWHHTSRFDASFTVLDSLDHPVSRRGAYVAYIGSGEHPVKVRILGTTALEPGTTGAVRIHLPVKLPLLPGDRFILRDSGREETVGGGTVLEVEPRKPASKAAPDSDPTRIVRERTVVRIDEFERLTGASWDGPVIGTQWAITKDELAARKVRLQKAVADAGPRGLDIALLTEVDRAVLDALVADPLVADASTGITTSITTGASTGADSVQLDGGHAILRSAPDPLADHPFVRALEASPFAPPDAVGVDRGELRELIRKGRVVESDGVYFAPLAIDQVTAIIRTLLATTTNEGVTVAEVRDAVGASRKHVLPLLAHLDATGRTRRRGDYRIAGPRMLREADE